jgi:hypothetical protein
MAGKVELKVPALDAEETAEALIRWQRELLGLKG